MISNAVVLMAGRGSRLRATTPKPLVQLLGRPLISYTFDALSDAGITNVYAIVGFEKDLVVAGVKPLIPKNLNVRFIENPDWQKQNGISLLAAAKHVSSPFLLTMSDHLFDQAIVDLVLNRIAPDQLNLAVDRKLDSVFDLDDATKIETRGDRIVAIGKQLERYDAIDTGLFVCPREIFDYLERAKRDGDCSLSDGVRAMSADGKVRAIDIGDAWWQDVDTVEMLEHAGKLISTERGLPAVVAEQCVILADSPSALIQLCGISILERLLRTLQRCGFKRAIVLSSSTEPIARELAGPSWARAELDLTIHARPAGPVTMEQIVDLWPEGAELLPIIPADSVFDQRLLRGFVSDDEPAALVDSDVPARLQALVASAPETKRGKFCGPALLRRDWARSRTGSLQEVLRAGLDDQTLTAIDVAAEPLYYAPLNRKLRAYWFPAPSADHAKLAKRVVLDSAQKGTLDFPAMIHSRIETFLISQLCETSITPNKLTILTNIVAWSATFLFATGRLGWGLALALIVGVLDGLDGKQARVKVETTKRGKLEHWFDAFFEISWWISIGYYFHKFEQLPGAFHYLALLLFAMGFDGILKSSVRFATGRSIEELGTFERILHLVSGRRNVFVWLMTIGFLLGAPAKAFIIMTYLALVTLILHLPRTIWIFSRLHKGSQIQGTSPKVLGVK